MEKYSITKCIRIDKQSKKTGKCPIYLRIRVRHRDMKLSTQLQVEVSKWDNNRQEPKDYVLRNKLNSIVTTLENGIYKANINEEILTVDLIKDIYTGKYRKKVDIMNTSFYDYFLNFTKKKEKEDLASGTIDKYYTTLNILKEFKKDVLISDINLNFIEKFDLYMKEVRGNQGGGRFNKHKNIKTVIFDMQKRGILIKNPYAFFKIPQAKRKETYLTHSELVKMRALKVTLKPFPNQLHVLNLYIFSCHCGLRFSDTLNLKWSNIDWERNIIRVEQIKTKTIVQTPLLPHARGTLLAYSRGQKLDTNDKIFPQLKEPTVNKNLKKFAKMAGIDKHITFHCGRHTFGTLLVQNGIDIYKISKYMGHSSVKMTERYLQYNLDLDEEEIKQLNKAFC